MAAFFRQFSFPGGVPSHCAPETPGSFHEGGELGYSLLHAFGAALDQPDLIVFCVVGDGEAETGPLADELALRASSSTRPATARCCRSCPQRVQDRQPDAARPDPRAEELLDADARLRLRAARRRRRRPGRGAPGDGRGAGPLPGRASPRSSRPRAARADGHGAARWPMIVLRTPKGWTGPPVVDGQQVEGTFRAHQVPLPAARDRRRAPRGARGSGCGPTGPRSCSTTPAGRCRSCCDLVPDGRAADERQPGRQRRPRCRATCGCRTGGSYGVEVDRAGRDAARGDPGARRLAARGHPAQPGQLPDLRARRAGQQPAAGHPRGHRPRLAGRDRASTTSGSTARAGSSRCSSEHMCQGLLEGYLLTGRHGVFTCYEAFIHIVDSMFNQHAKWLEASAQVPWRRPIASLNYLLSSHVWRQDHNGFTHQDPGFLDVVMNKKPEIVRVYLPPDANTLLSTYDHCLRSRHYVNVVVAGKQPQADWLSVRGGGAALRPRRRHLGVGRQPTTSSATLPDVVLACAGDVPTLETLAAAAILRERLPDLRVRVVNVVDLMRLLPESEHPHGLPDREFDTLFTDDRPVIFAFHGYPWLIHRLTYRRHQPRQPARARLQGERAPRPRRSTW